jgi:hypothetical protein
VPKTSTPKPLANGKGVYVVGDLISFGNAPVRAGLQALLRGQTAKPPPGHRTHSKLTPAQRTQLEALLKSKDPKVVAALKTRIPDKQSVIVSADGRILGKVDTRDKVIPNQSLGVAIHAKPPKVPGARGNVDRSAGGRIDVGNKSHRVIGTELHSPIKIALDGSHATLNSTNGFALDVNGFDAAGGVAKTSGGLNANEAWLVRDRAGDGIAKNGVVDGDDVYGDHQGQFNNGYEDLARDFADEVKVDPTTGRRYLDLADPNSRAAKELQLLDAGGRLRSASSVVSRIDVDAVSVAESDTTGKNQIRERAEVTYRDGRTALSADQWYATLPTRG